MHFNLRKTCGVGFLVLCLGQGCGEPHAPVIGPNLVSNGSFEAELAGWWSWTDSTGGKASTGAEAADEGRAGLVLYKGKDGFNSMVGQTTELHQAWETYEIRARVKGAIGGEHVTFSYHGYGFEVVAEPYWQTVSQLVLLPEPQDDSNARISVTTDEATAYVDTVSFALADVERGTADKEKNNLIHNGSFESQLGLWALWTDSPTGTATTTPDARVSGYAGLVLSRGTEGSYTLLKQSLRDPVFSQEQYRIEADIWGATGLEQVTICLQLDREPYAGPCVAIPLAIDLQHLSQTVTIDDALNNENISVVVSLSSEGTAYLDDVIVVRTQGH
ncbi:carbohydrate binding domain-containing protein [Hyalangium versicolor]|uniref:carbohydrate binding domain-containing protein n=1 Tax=Hyalangium versicolor TaxID=2861190 RepID=UPI001CCB94CE|nr:carbohydrate binding domain-containing protein [Hyalangium versicolor]